MEGCDEQHGGGTARSHLVRGGERRHRNPLATTEPRQEPPPTPGVRTMPLAITYAAAGDPADVLAATEIPDPPPTGPGQVQIAVRAFPIHPGDLVGVRFAPPAPGERVVAGLEATGVVVAVGPGVSTPAVSTRVTVFPNPGSWAQLINVPAELAVPVPDSVSDDVAAQMVCNPLTALLLYRAAQQHFSVGFDGFVINN